MKSKMGKRALALLLCMVIVLGGTEYMRAGNQEGTEDVTPATSEEEIVLSEDGEQQAAEGETTDVADTGSETDAETVTQGEEPKSEDASPEESDASETKQDAASETGENNDASTTTETEKKEEDAETTETEKKTETEKTAEELAKVEEEKPILELSYEDDQVSITVKADKEGNIPQGASLKVTPIEKTEVSSDMDAEAKAEAEAINAQYDTTAEKLKEKAEGEEYDILGFLAYDITFVDKNDDKLEPNGSVSVSMDYQEAAIPDEVKEAKEAGTEIQDVTLMHLEEDEQGEVKDVVDMVADESQTAEVKTTENTEVKKVEFKTESFSTFVLTWKNLENNKIDINVVDTSGNEITFIKYTENWSGDAAVPVADIGNGTKETWNLKGWRFQEARLDDWKTGTKINFLKGTDSGWQYTSDESSDNASWENIGESKVYFVYKLSSKGLTDLDNNSVSADQLQTMINEADKGDLPISWTRYGLYSGNSITTAQKGLSWTWSTITKNLDQPETTLENQIWDGSRLGSHNLTRYLDENEITASNNKLYDSATWSIPYGKDEILTRFQGTFSLDDLQKTKGYNDYTDYTYTIKSVVDSEKIFINDNLFVFVYPSEVTITDDNYMDYLAFWTGTSNRDGVLTFHEKEGTTAYHTDQSIWSKLTDQWYAEPVTDGAGDIIQKAVQDRYRDFKIDVIVHDNATGGGMYRLIIDAEPVQKTPVSLYKVEDENIERGLAGATFELKNDETSATYTISTKGTDGKTETVYLTNGTYTMVEKTAPAGYEKSENQWTVKVKNEQFTIEQKSGTEDDNKANFGEFERDGNTYYYITNQKSTTPDHPDSDELGTPEHRKYIKDNGKGTYTLTLDVTGKQGDTVGADVLLVIDKSGSMGKNKQGSTDSTYFNLLPTLKNVVRDTIVKKIFESDTDNINQLATVSFSSDSYKTYDIETKWVKANGSSGVTSQVNGLSAKGGTNWQLAMRYAENKLKEESSDNNKKYVIFLSDGVPTYYYQTKWGKENEEGDGNKYEEQGLTNAVSEVANSTYLKNATIYSVYLTSGTKEKMVEFAEKISAGGGKAIAVDGKDMDSAMNNILSSILTPAYKDVVIEDELSDYAEFVLSNDQKPEFTVTAIAKDGTPITLRESDYSVNWSGKKFSLDLSKVGDLEAGTTYSISVNIKPTTAAYAKYLRDGYNQYGDKNTDAADNTTSSDKAGFRCNTENGAVLQYKINGDGTEKTASYKHPVIQVTPKTVSHKVKKVWQGGVEESVQVKLKATYQKDGQEFPVPENFQALTAKMRKQVTLRSEDNEGNEAWSYTWTGLPKYYYYTDSNEQLVETKIIYTVKELSDYSGKYNVTYTDPTDTEETDQDDTGTDDMIPLTTIINTAKAKWQIVKVSQNEPSLKLGGAEFTLTAQNAAEDGTTVIYYGVSEKDTGVVTWYDAPNHAAPVTSIPVGTYTLAETKAPGGYALNAEQWTITVAADGTWKVENSSGQAVDPNESTEKQKDEEGNETDVAITVNTFTFKDTPVYALPSTGGIGTYWYTIGGMLLMMAAALILYKKKTR